MQNIASYESSEESTTRISYWWIHTVDICKYSNHLDMQLQIQIHIWERTNYTEVQERTWWQLQEEQYTTNMTTCILLNTQSLFIKTSLTISLSQLDSYTLL